MTEHYEQYWCSICYSKVLPGQIGPITGTHLCVDCWEKVRDYNHRLKRVDEIMQVERDDLARWFASMCEARQSYINELNGC